MKLLRSIIALVFVLSSSLAIAQTNQGSSPLTIAKGGTNASTASAARAALGVAIGSNVQAWDADLDALAGLTYAADKCTYFTGTHTAATFDCLSWSRAVISAANAGAGRTAFGLAIGTDVQGYDADLAAIAGLTSANNKCFYWTGSGTAANYDCTSYGRGLINSADASAARTTLGSIIGTDVQAFDADLSALAAFSSTGLAARTASNTWAQRTLQPPAAGMTITNPAGVAGDPTFVLANDLAALEGLSSTGIARRTGTDAWSVGTLVTNAELATMANATFKCRTTAGTGAPEDCTATQSTALLNAMVGDSGSGGTKGLVPAPGAGDAAAGKYLKADGTFAVPPGTGGGGSYPDVDRQNSLLLKIYQSKSFAEYRRFINEFTTGFKGASDALNGVLTASSSNYSVTAASGFVEPTTGSGTANTAITPTLGSNSTGYGGFAARQSYATAILSAAAGTKIRITFRPPTSGNNSNITNVSVGPSTTPPTFDSTPIGITFSGGNLGTTLTAGGGDVVSDDVTYTYSAATPLLIHVEYTGTSDARISSGLGTNYHSWQKSATSGAQFVLSGSGYGDNSGFNASIAKVEMIVAGTANNMTLVTLPQTSDSSISSGRVLVEYDNTATPTLNTDLTAEVSCKLNTATVTITNASPGVVSHTSHGLSVGDPVIFTTSGALPTGLTAGSTYFVSTVVNANSYQVSATPGGAAINTSSAGSGTHTASSYAWAAASLSAVTSYSGGSAGGIGQRKVAESVDQACNASGTSFTSRIKTLNNKAVKFYGVSKTVH